MAWWFAILCGPLSCHQNFREIWRHHLHGDFFSLRQTRKRIGSIWKFLISSSVYINQRDAHILVNNIYFFVKWRYMFWAIISPSSGATFNKLYSAIGICRYVWLQPDLPAYTNCTVQLIKCCSWWWTNDSPKHVAPFNKKIKIIHKNMCISLVYMHIAIWCTVHTTSN